MTVLVGCVLVVGLLWLVGRATVPYVEFVPGPTFDTLGKDPTGKDVIVVTGAPATSSTGQLRFLTIGGIRNLTLLQALVGWWRHDDAVVPRELVFTPGETEQQYDQQNAEDFANSQSAAASAAEIALGYPLKVTVKEVIAGQPAVGKLQVGDLIRTIDGQAIDSPDRMVQLIRSKPAGTTLTFGLTRAGKEVTVAIATVADANKVPRVGFSSDATSTAPFSFKVPIENVGGPSAGLMLTLGMIDKIKPEDLTGGKVIAGTGTINALGTVGPIGGIPQKIIAARDAGAQFFLTPEENCAEAVANQEPGLPQVRVANLAQALSALADIRAGRQPPLCPGAH